MKRNVMLVIILALVLSLWFSLSLSAQEAVTGGQGQKQPVNPTPLYLWTIIIAIVGLAFAAVGGAWSQSKALRTAVDNIGRNPAAADAIRGILIIGLALIESLVIYVLLIDFIIIGKWGQW